MFYTALIHSLNLHVSLDRNGKRGQQGWERKYVILDGTKLSVYDTEPAEGQQLFFFVVVFFSMHYIFKEIEFC